MLTTARSLIPGLLLAVLAVGCSRPKEAPIAAWHGSYRASLQLPGGELPFGLELEPRGTALVGWLVNGAERIRVDEVTVKDETISLRMPGFENIITATKAGDNLRGELFFVKAKGKNQNIPLFAVRDQPARFFPAGGTPGGDISGRWAVTFTEDDNNTYIAVGEFTQRGDAVQGTFLTPTGDYRYLNGELRDGRLYLSTFNGGHVFLFHAALGSDGATMQGEFWSGLASHERFTAKRDANASLGNTTAVTAVRNTGQPFTFSFPDLNGKNVSLADEQFRGKVVFITLAGSWCPNCHDEAQWLTQYYADHRAEGLEAIGLMFEQLESKPAALAAIARYRDKYRIGFPLLLAGISDTDSAATKLPQLNGVFAYPTSLLIDRKGLVRHIHTGFSGPATGQHYTDLITDLDQRIQTLLAEKN
jgi:peroxiredoxin